MGVFVVLELLVNPARPLVLVLVGDHLDDLQPRRRRLDLEGDVLADLDERRIVPDFVGVQGDLLGEVPFEEIPGHGVFRIALFVWLFGLAAFGLVEFVLGRFVCLPSPAEYDPVPLRELEVAFLQPPVLLAELHLHRQELGFELFVLLQQLEVQII